MLKIIGRTVAAKLTGKRYTSAGAALQGRLLKVAAKAGVDIRPETPVRELVEESGKITGVVAEKDGQPWRVGAALGVLVNAGGFSRNQEMRDKYQPGTSVEWSSTATADTGEMIREMMNHGAAVAQMEEMVGNQCTLPPGTKYDQAGYPERDRQTPRHPGGPVREVLHERGRILHGVLPEYAGPQQGGAGSTELGGFRQ